MMNTTIDDSNQEHNIRISCPAFSGLTCVNCSFHNGDGKEDVAPRQGHHLKFYNCTFNGQYPIFMGEGSPGPLTPAQARAQCSDLEFYDCILTHGGYSVRYAQDVLIDGGSVVIDASAGDGNEYVAGLVSSGTNVTYQNMLRCIIGQTAKPIFRNKTGDPAAVKDGGGNVTKFLPTTMPSTVQPAPVLSH